MWIGKKKWKEMEEKINNIEFREQRISSMNLDLEARVLLLEKCHLNEKDLPNFHCFEGERKVFASVSHKCLEVSTDTIPNITLEELAKFVIDGEPIKRKEEIDVEYRKEDKI